MIHLITGRPGAGKGLCMMEQIIGELETTTRPIVTNFAVEILPWVTGAPEYKPQRGLEAYLTQRWGGNRVKVKAACDRVFRVTDDEIAEFYLYRPQFEDGVWRMAKADAERTVDKAGDAKVVSFDTGLLRTGGVAYYIDEAWKFWGSRNWAKTGEGVIFYNSQHRKVGDDVMIATQSFKQVDTAIIRVCQDFWHCRNRGFLKVGQLFRQPDNIKVHIYENPPVGSAVPMENRTMKVDAVGLGQCYDTTAGVGLSGRMVGDMGRKKVGLSFKWLIFGACCIPVVIIAFLTMGVNKGNKMLGKAIVGGSGAVKGWTSNAVASVVGGGASLNQMEKEKGGQVEAPKKKVYFVSRFGTEFRLSDGRVFDSRRRDIVCRDPGWISIGTNVWFAMKPGQGVQDEPVRPMRTDGEQPARQGPSYNGVTPTQAPVSSVPPGVAFPVQSATSRPVAASQVIIFGRSEPRIVPKAGQSWMGSK